MVPNMSQTCLTWSKQSFWMIPSVIRMLINAFRVNLKKFLKSPTPPKKNENPHELKLRGIRSHWLYVMLHIKSYFLIACFFSDVRMWPWRCKSSTKSPRLSFHLRIQRWTCLSSFKLHLRNSAYASRRHSRKNGISSPLKRDFTRLGSMRIADRMNSPFGSPSKIKWF